MTFHAITAVPLSIVTALGVLGNLLTLLTTVRAPLKTSMNALMLNLALCDLVFEVVDCIPMTMYTAQSYWPFGAGVCKAHNYFRTVTVYVSSYTVMFMCTDRFLFLKRPDKDRRRNYIAAVIWLWVVTAIGSCYTFSITRVTGPPYSECTLIPNATITKMHFVVKFALAFCVPLSLAGVFIAVSCCLACRYQEQYRHYTACNADVHQNCVAESRVHLMLAPRFRNVGNPGHDDDMEVRRLTITVCTILVITAIFWLPYYVMELMMIYDSSHLEKFGMRESYWLAGVSLCLAYIIPAARPIVYFILLPNFRHQCRKTLTCARRRPEHFDVNSYSLSPTHQRSRETTV